MSLLLRGAKEILVFFSAVDGSQLSLSPCFVLFFSVPSPVFSLPLLLPLLLYFLVRLSIGYDDLMSSCKFSSPDDCVKFVFGSSVGVLAFFFSYYMSLLGLVYRISF